MPTQMPRNGRPLRDAATASSASPEACNAVMQAPNAPTPGSTTAAASRISPRSAVRRASAPTCSREVDHLAQEVLLAGDAATESVAVLVVALLVPLVGSGP